MLLGDNGLSKTGKEESKPLGECLSVFFRDLFFFSVYMSFKRSKLLELSPAFSFLLLFLALLKGQLLSTLREGGLAVKWASKWGMARCREHGVETGLLGDGLCDFGLGRLKQVSSDRVYHLGVLYCCL